MEIFPRSSAPFVADSLSDPRDRFVGLGDEVLADTRRAVQAPGGLRAERSVQADYGQVTTVDVTI